MSEIFMISRSYMGTSLEKQVLGISVKRIATLNATFKMTELEFISQTEN